MRNHRPVQPGHATGGGGRGRKEKEKDEEKRKKKGREGKGRRSEIRAYIYIYTYICVYTWRTIELPFTTCRLPCSFQFCGRWEGEGGGNTANPSQDLVFTITNKTGARVRSLARITRYTFAISGSLAAGQGALKRPRHE